ncbi:MAG TPA: hypothetical protein VFB45_09555 [Pseudolabrys sp.]|nr:hypothetical protein [Pseudolabrys sp.]
MNEASNAISQDGEPVTALSYSYRPSLMGAAWAFALGADALEWQVGRRSGRVPYAAIRRMRLSFRPGTMQSQRFRAEIWSDGHPKLDIVSSTWKSMAEQVQQGEGYARFIVELHRRIAAAGGAVTYETGTTPVLYWCGVAVFIACALAIASLIVRALQVAAWSGAAFIAAFLALFLWQGGNYFRRNRPGTYRPDALPKQLVPN